MHNLATPLSADQLPTSMHQLCHCVQTTMAEHSAVSCSCMPMMMRIITFLLFLLQFSLISYLSLFLSFFLPTPPPTHHHHTLSHSPSPHTLHPLHPRMSVQSTSSVTTRRARAITWWMWTATACWTSTHRSPQSLLVSSITLFFSLIFFSCQALF